MVREGVQPVPVTLAIGDGANDVPMLQQAQVYFVTFELLELDTIFSQFNINHTSKKSIKPAPCASSASGRRRHHRQRRHAGSQ